MRRVRSMNRLALSCASLTTGSYDRPGDHPQATAVAAASRHSSATRCSIRAATTSWDLFMGNYIVDSLGLVWHRLWQQASAPYLRGPIKTCIALALPAYMLNVSICASSPIFLSTATSVSAAPAKDCSWPGWICIDTFDAGTVPINGRPEFPINLCPSRIPKSRL